LHWYQNQKAIAVNVYAGSKEGSIALNLLTWTEKPQQYWYVENGVLKGY
jgi:hypothetical protein